MNHSCHCADDLHGKLISLAKEENSMGKKKEGQKPSKGVIVDLRCVPKDSEFSVALCLQFPQA